MKTTRKRILSLLMSGIMAVSLLPSELARQTITAKADDEEAGFSHGLMGGSSTKDDTDLTIDFKYAEKNNVQSPDDAMRLLGEGKIESYQVDSSKWYNGYSEHPWRHPTTIEPNSKGDSEDIRTYLESTDDADKYIALKQDIIVGPDQRANTYFLTGAIYSPKWWDNRDKWETIKITTDKVLDLNGHKLEITYAGNINHDKDMESTGQERWVESHYLTAFEIANGATLTIIDSSEWRGKGKGKIGFYAGWVQHHDFDMYWYDHRDLFHIKKGNLIVYGGTLEAGGSKMMRKTDKNFSWGKVKDCIGMAVELGVNIAKYSTGITAADAAYRDVLQDVADMETGKGNPEVKSEPETVKQTPGKEEGGRNQTIKEKALEKDKKISEGQKGTPEGENQADSDGKAKNDKNTRVTKAQNEIVNQAVNKDGIMGMVNSGFALFDKIDEMCGTKDREPISNNIKGTVVRIGTAGTFASYGGHFIGYGSTPNSRNAVIEVAWTDDEWTYDKKKQEGGRAYIYDGEFEANSGANVFNMYRGIEETALPAIQYIPDTKNKKIVPTEVKITYDEHYGAEPLFYQNQYDLEKATIKDGISYDAENHVIEPVPINTANVQVRGGTFHCHYDVLNMAKLEEDDYGYNNPDGEHFRKFPGTSGSVNLGVDSFGADLIRDGRIQLVDNADGCLVLLDDDEEGYNGLYHYRLLCGDNELRTKCYLDVSPNEAQTNSSFSMQLAHYSGTGRSTHNIFKDDEDNIRAPYRQMENYFDYNINATNADNYSIKPNFHYDTAGSEKEKMDVYGSWLANSEVWYYPEPLDFEGKPLKNEGYYDAILKQSNNSSGNTKYLYDSEFSSLTWAGLTKYNPAGTTNETMFYEGRTNIRTNMKYFTYKIYKVDPLTRENIPADPKAPYGADDPLITVRYGAGTDDPLKCKIPLVDIAERIRNTRTELNWQGYQPGEMYRVVLEVEERIGAGVAPVSYDSPKKDAYNHLNVGSHYDWKWGQQLDTAKTTTSIMFRCYQTSEQHGDGNKYNEKDFTPAQWSYNAWDMDLAVELPPLPDDASDEDKAKWARQKEAASKKNSIAAGETAQINLLNAKTGMTDFEGDVQVFDIYYQWWEVDENGKEIRLLAGTDNVFDDGLDKHTEFATKDEYNKYIQQRIAQQKAADPANKDTYDLEDKTQHHPKGWNFDYVKPDGTMYQYANTVDPDSWDAEYMDTNGLPKRSKDGNWEWSAEQIHLYSGETTQGRKELTRWSGNLSLKNNNVYAFNTDTCYIPKDMAGKYLQVKVIALNMRWPVAYDKKQTFKSHIVKVIDPEEELKIAAWIDYDKGMDYATFDHPAELRVGDSKRKLVKGIDEDGNLIYRGGALTLNELAENEYITSVTYRVNGKEKTFTGLKLNDPKEQPVALYPNDFYEEGYNLKNLKAREADVEVEITTSKGIWTRTSKSPVKKLDYEVETESVIRYGNETQAFKLADIQDGKYESRQLGTSDLFTEAGVQIFGSMPLNASVGYDFTKYTNTDPKVGTLNPNGYFIFKGNCGETTITVSGTDGEDVSKTIRVVEDVDSFELSGVRPPVVGEKLDFTSLKVPDGAPYRINDVKWYSFGKEISEDDVAEYNHPYSIEISVTPNEFCDASGSYIPYNLMVGLTDGSYDTVTGNAYSEYNSDTQAYDTYTLSYTYPALTDHDAKTIDEVYMNFPTEVREGDNFLKWLENVEIYTNGYNEGFKFKVTPTYGPEAEKIAAAYGYSFATNEQINLFIKGVQTGIAAEIEIPYELRQLGDAFAENVRFYVNGVESKNKLEFGSDHIRLAAPDTLTILDGDGEAPPVKPAFYLEGGRLIVGETLDLHDLIVCDDPRVDVVMTDISIFGDKDKLDDYVTYDLEAATVTPIKELSYTSSADGLKVYYTLGFDADGDGYPECQRTGMNEYSTIYASADDAPPVTPAETTKPVNVRITVLTPDGKTASDGEYTYDFNKSVIQIPDGFYLTGIYDADGNRTSESLFMDGASYTVKTVSTDSIEIHSGTDSVYAFFKDADGRNVSKMQISVDNLHYTTGDCITGLKPETEYTLYYRQGADGKVYTKKFRTAKKDYCVYIGRQPVTTENLGDLETDGWHYDPETKTLTLKDFTLTDSGVKAYIEDWSGYSIYSYGTICSADDLNVVLIGENTIELRGEGLGDAVVWSDKNLTIEGNGTLILKESGSSLGTYGLYSKEGDINLNGTGTIGFNGVYFAMDSAKGSINYKNGTIDYKPATTKINGSTYVVGGFLPDSSKDALKLDGAVHTIEISTSTDGENYKAINEDAFSPKTADYLHIIPQHNDVNKTASAENLESGTCDEGCTYHLTCDCGHISEETFRMPAEEHSLVKHAAKPATCTESGTVAYWECELCGERYADAEGTRPLASADIVIAPLGHELVHNEARHATCTEDGVSEYWTCSRCGINFADKDGIIKLGAEPAVIPATGHDWIHYYAKEASCEKDGTIEYWKCANCGKYSADKDGTVLLTADDVRIKAIGHTWGEWTVVKEAEEGIEGEEIRVCSHCDETEKKVIPAKQPAETTTTAKPTTTTTAKTTTTTAKPATTTAKATTTATKPATTTAKPATTTAKPTTTTAKPTTTTARPTTTTVKPTTATTTKPTTTTAKATTTTAKPTTTTAKPTTTTAVTTTTTTARPTTTTAVPTTTTTARPTTTTAVPTTTTTARPTTTTAVPTTTTTAKSTTTTVVPTTTTEKLTTTTTTPATTTTAELTTTTTEQITTTETPTTVTEPAETQPVTTTESGTGETIPADIGDVNSDGVVDSSDASEVLMIYAMVSTGGGELSEEQKSVADINGDGLVDSSDASLILEYYAYVSTGGTDTADVYFSKEQDIT